MIQTIITGFLLAWFFTEFPLFTSLVEKIRTNKYSCKTNRIISNIKSALRCHKYMSLYITITYGLIFLGQFCFIEAIAASFLAAVSFRIMSALPFNL